MIYIPRDEPQKERWTLAVVLFYVMKQKVDETKTTVFESSRTTFTAELQSDANVR